MMNTFQNVSNQDGRTKFVSVDTTGAITELYTTSKTVSAPIPGGRVSLVKQTLSLQSQSDVTCPDDTCQKAFILEGVRIEFTARRGNSVRITELVTRAKGILDAWREDYQADNGLPPLVSATFPATEG